MRHVLGMSEGYGACARFIAKHGNLFHVAVLDWQCEDLAPWEQFI